MNKNQVNHQSFVISLLIINLFTFLPVYSDEKAYT